MTGYWSAPNDSKKFEANPLLTKDKNDLLTHTGPGTPMGDLFRCYWHPALLAEELPEPDCPPVRVKLLSERLIAFRDSDNRLGLMDELCAHRRVSLWFGRNEEGGLRCAYHGWKYDESGQCIEQPGEDEAFAAKVRIRIYPTEEYLGLTFKSSQALGVTRECLGQDLNGDITVQRCVTGSIDLSHAALADEGGDGVGTQASAGG